MVCPRCIEAVKEVLQKLEIETVSIQLGEVSLVNELKSERRKLLDEKLKVRGFELLEDKISRISEHIKNLIIQAIRKPQVDLKTTFSKYLESEMGKEYGYLSKLFSSVEGVTIEQFVILQKTERVKELLVYNELTLSQISYQLNYSSVQHLSNQFKKVTGMSPSTFKGLQNKNRKPLDKVINIPVI